MAKFTDTEGRDWPIVIDLGVVYLFRRETGTDIFKASTEEIPGAMLWEIGYFSVKDLAKERGYGDITAWLKGIGKRSVLGLSEAVATELAEFFPEPIGGEELLGSDPQTAVPTNGEMSSDSPVKPV